MVRLHTLNVTVHIASIGFVPRRWERTTELFRW